MKYPLSKFSDFLDNIFSNLNEKNIDCADFFLDHIAYRTQTKEEYDDMKNEVDSIGEIASENIISGRPIAVYKLIEPLKYKNRIIDCLEIVSPREGAYFDSGLEHAEFVTKNDLRQFMKKYPEVVFIDETEKKKNNPEIIIQFEDKTAVKFHNRPLLEVVEMEKNN